MSHLSATARMAAPQHLTRDRATYTSQSLPPSTVVITVEGELDAANTAHFGSYVELRLSTADKLVLLLERADRAGGASVRRVSRSVSANPE